MILSIVWIIIGLALILVGANALTDGASAIAKRFGLSDLTVGLTVVAFGTSTPELVISLMSAIDGSGGMAVGNVIGSDLFNILVIIGVTALVRPIRVEQSVMTRELPMSLMAAIVLLIVCNGILLDGDVTDTITRSSGLLLLMFMVLFLWYTIASAKNTATDTDPVAAEAADAPAMPMWRAIVWTVGGLAMLIVGGDRFVDGATGVAHVLGVSDAIIGLTVAAIGTSLPELATSIVASMKGRAAMAVGNVVGSNIFNVFAVLGISATASPLKFSGIDNFDLLMLVGASVAFVVVARRFGDRVINRYEGGAFLVAYIAYVAIKIATL